MRSTQVQGQMEKFSRNLTTQAKLNINQDSIFNTILLPEKLPDTCIGIGFMTLFIYFIGHIILSITYNSIRTIYLVKSRERYGTKLLCNFQKSILRNKLNIFIKNF